MCNLYSIYIVWFVYYSVVAIVIYQYIYIYLLVLRYLSSLMSNIFDKNRIARTRHYNIMCISYNILLLCIENIMKSCWQTTSSRVDSSSYCLYRRKKKVRVGVGKYVHWQKCDVFFFHTKKSKYKYNVNIFSKMSSVKTKFLYLYI